MKKLLTLCVLLSGLIGSQAATVEMTPIIPAANPPAVKNIKKAPAFADQVVVDNVKYGIDKAANKAVVLGAGEDDIFDLDIPETVSFEGTDYPVTEIGRMAFYQNGTIESINFPSGLKYIGSWSFMDCSALQSVTLPDGIEKVDSCAFRHCVSLESVDLGNGIKEPGYGSFMANPGLTSIVIPASVTSMGDFMLNGCTNLTSITFEATSLNTLGYGAISETGISNIVLPATINVVKNNACGRCPNLTTATLPTNLTEVPFQIFTMCVNLESIELPSNYTAIAGEAFYGCSKLATINLENITRFDHACLYETHALTGALEFNENTTYIGDFSFRGSAISSIKVGPNCETIDNYAFWACTNMKTAELAEGLQSIGQGAFGQTPIMDFTIPSTVVDVEGYAFYQMGNLQNLICKPVDVPEMVTAFDLVDNYSKPTLYVPEESMEAYAAAEYWKKFTKVKPLSEAPVTAWVTINDAEYYLDLKNGTAILINGMNVTGDFVVPNTVSATRDGACTVIGIADQAFNQNGNLTGITLNEDLQSIGVKAFAETNITALHLGAKVETVGINVHYKATKLAEITVDENNPYLCAENSLLMTKDKKQVIAFPVANPATELIIPDETEIVLENAVNRCKNLKKIVVGNGCKTIDRQAFDNCTEATELILGDNIETIDYQAFRSLKSVTALKFPKNLKYLYDYSFSFTWSLKEAVLPEGLLWLCGGALNRCDAMERVELPASLTFIGQTPFSNCPALTEMVNHAETPLELTNDLFSDETLYSTVTLFVPEGCTDNYKAANIWKKFFNIEELPATSVDGVKTAAEATVEGIYTIDGKRTEEMLPGVNIVRMSDGSTKKIVK